jgi:hypothetical protein
MGNIREVTTTIFVDDENEIEYTLEPVEDTLKLIKTNTGYEARYLVIDECSQSPTDVNGDDNDLFLVNYHRDFDVRKDDIIGMEQVRDYYRGNPEDMPEGYWFFKLSMLSHSGVTLALNNSLDQYYMGWDTSHVGLVCVSKNEWPEEDKAFKAAESLVEQWNQYLHGEVFGIVKETYNKDKEQIHCESVWGFYGFEYAQQALETDI